MHKNPVALYVKKMQRLYVAQEPTQFNIVSGLTIDSGTARFCGEKS